MLFSRVTKLFCLFSVAFDTFTSAVLSKYFRDAGYHYKSKTTLDRFGILHIAQFKCITAPNSFGSFQCICGYGTFTSSTLHDGRDSSLHVSKGKTRISLFSYAFFGDDSQGVRVDYAISNSLFQHSNIDILSRNDHNYDNLSKADSVFLKYTVGQMNSEFYEVTDGVLLKDTGEYYHNRGNTHPHRFFKHLGKITDLPLEFSIQKKAPSTSKICYGFSGILDWRTPFEVMFGHYYDHYGDKYDNARTACRSHNTDAIDESVTVTTQNVGKGLMILIKNNDLWTVDIEPTSTQHQPLKTFLDNLFAGVDGGVIYEGLDSFGLIHSKDVITTQSDTPDNLLKYIVITTASVGVKHNYDVDNSESERVFSLGNIDDSDAEYKASTSTGNFASCVVIGSFKVTKHFTLLYGLYANIGGLYFDSYRSCINDSEESDSTLYIKKKRMNGFDRFLVYKDQKSGVSFDIDSDSQSLNAYFLTKNSIVEVDVKNVAPSIPEILVPLVKLSSDKYSFDFDGQNGNHHPYYVKKHRLYDNLISLDDAIDKTNPFIPFEMQLTRKPSLNFICLGVSQAWLSPENILFLFGVFSNGHTKWDNPEDACKNPLDPQQSQDPQQFQNPQVTLSGALNIRIQYVDVHFKLRILVWTSEGGGYYAFEQNDEKLSSDFPEEIKATHIGLIHSGDFVDFVKVPVVGDMRRTIPVGALKDGDYPDMLMNGRYFREIGNISSTIQDFTVTKLASTNVLGLGIGHVTDYLPYLLSAALSDGNQIYFEDLGETVSIPTHLSEVPATYLIRVQRVGDEILAVVYLNGVRTKFFRVNDADTSDLFNIVVVMHHMDIGEVITSIPEVKDQCVC